MDPVQTPAPTINTPTAPVVAQDDLFDRFLKWLVAMIGKLINKSTTVASSAVTAVTPTVAPGTPQTLLGGIWATLGNVANSAINITGNIADTAVNLTGSVASGAVNLTETGVNSVVQGAQNIVAPASTPEQAANNVQDFLSQNYQATPEVTPTVVEAPKVDIPTA